MDLNFFSFQNLRYCMRNKFFWMLSPAVIVCCSGYSIRDSICSSPRLDKHFRRTLRCRIWIAWIMPVVFLEKSPLQVSKNFISADVNQNGFFVFPTESHMFHFFLAQQFQYIVCSKNVALYKLIISC